MKKTILIFALLSCAWSGTHAQSWFQRHPLTVTVGNQNISTPFYKSLGGPFNPGFIASYEWYYGGRNSSNWDLFQTVNVGLFLAKHSQQSWHASSSLGYRYTTPLGIFVEGALELGAQHVFHKSAVYERAGSGYEQVTDHGKLFAMAGVNTSLGYDFLRSGKRPVGVFLKYRVSGIMPFPDLFVLPQQYLGLGLRFFVK